jgi:glutamate/tyrosine decarboxylase-like PLP-dependent enzyme
MIENSLVRARYLGQIVETAPDLELLADVGLNVVCFRYNPGQLSEPALNAVNERLGQALIEDGRVFVGTTTYAGKVALRPAIVNWRTRTSDIDVLAATVRELGAAVAQERIEA